MSMVTGRRQLTIAIAGCTAGAGLVLFAASRTWAVLTTDRPAPLGPVEQPRTGASLFGWLPALALVALAGAAALPATRRGGRLVIAAVLAAAGAGIAATGVYAVTQGAVTQGAAAGWPMSCVLGGLVVAAIGGFTAVRGHGWPAMGSRYDRAQARPHVGSDVQAWDAIDRGEDPTR